MKFGRLLHNFSLDAEEPECLLDYNMLKKKLKASAASLHQEGTGATQSEPLDSDEASGTPKGALTEAERSFIELLNRETTRINEFFIEKEEAAVIRLKALEDRVGTAAGPKELSQLGSALIDFHGEMVLLLHWSLVNYAAVAKILKKHDKLTGSLLRAPYLANMLQQPFLSTESISRLVRRAEQQVQLLAADAEEGETNSGEEATTSLPGMPHRQHPHPQQPPPQQQQQVQQQQVQQQQQQVVQQQPPRPPLVKRTHAALGMLKELTEKASTPSTLLPPGATDPAPADMLPAKRQRLGEGGVSSHQ